MQLQFLLCIVHIASQNLNLQSEKEYSNSNMATPSRKFCLPIMRYIDTSQKNLNFFYDEIDQINCSLLTSSSTCEIRAAAQPSLFVIACGNVGWTHLKQQYCCSMNSSFDCSYRFFIVVIVVLHFTRKIVIVCKLVYATMKDLCVLSDTVESERNEWYVHSAVHFGIQLKRSWF